SRPCGQNEQGAERGPLHPQSADRRTAKSEDKISLPVTGHRPISNLRGALADHDLGGDEGFSFAVDPRSRHAAGTAGAEAGGQLAPQCASALNVKGLVNRLVT